QVLDHRLALDDLDDRVAARRAVVDDLDARPLAAAEDGLGAILDLDHLADVAAGQHDVVGTVALAGLRLRSRWFVVDDVGDGGVLVPVVHPPRWYRNQAAGGTRQSGPYPMRSARPAACSASRVSGHSSRFQYRMSAFCSRF